MAGLINRDGMMLQKALPLFCGYDPRTPIGFAVCVVSALRRATIPLEIHPLRQFALRKEGQYKRTGDEQASTDFAFTRFLTPYLCDYEGYAVFVDGADMIVQADLRELLESIDPDVAVSVVKHPEYEPAGDVKFWGAVQHKYPRKNWSSVMVFNCAHPDCGRLNPETVSNESGAYLHRFEWTDSIGSLNPRWNVLIDEPDWMHQITVPKPAIIHYTRGIPGVPQNAGWMDREAIRVWLDEVHAMNAPQSVQDVANGLELVSTDLFEGAA